MINNNQGTYKWETDYYHNDNTFTMQDFLENHLSDGFLLLLNDGSCVEIQNKETKKIYRLNAKGDGDSYHHIIEWTLI